MFYKTIIALFAVAAVGLVSPSVASAAGGSEVATEVAASMEGVASVVVDFAEADLVPTPANTVIPTAMAATTMTMAAAIWFVSA